jgi:hypothetical protein
MTTLDKKWTSAYLIRISSKRGALSLGISKFCPEGLGRNREITVRNRSAIRASVQVQRRWLCAPCQYVNTWAVATRWPDPAQRFILIHGLLGLRSSTVAWQYVEFITASSSFIYWPTMAIDKAQLLFKTSIFLSVSRR